MKKHISFLALVLILASVFCLAGCSGGDTSGTGVFKATKDATSYPLSFQDDLGNAVTVEAEPMKVVSLSPANTEIIADLAMDKLAGHTDYCDYPEGVANIPSIGDYFAPNTEKIIGLDPDVVCAAEYIDDNVRAQLEGAGITVIVLKATSVDAVEQDILMMGQVLNKNENAAQTVELMEKERTAIVDTCKKAETPKSVFIDLGDYYSSGDGSLQDDILQQINAKNIAAGTGSNVPQLSVEQIIAANPDVYISLFTDEASIKKVPGFDTVNAVKNNAVIAFDMTSEEASEMQRPGPRIVTGMKHFAETVYPELFK